MANPYATDKSAISRFAPFLDSILIERKSTAVDSTRPTPGLGTDRTGTNCFVTRWKTNPRAHFDDELCWPLETPCPGTCSNKYRADRLLNAERRGPAHGEFRHRCGRGLGVWHRWDVRRLGAAGWLLWLCGISCPANNVSVRVQSDLPETTLLRTESI